MEHPVCFSWQRLKRRRLVHCQGTSHQTRSQLGIEVQIHSIYHTIHPQLNYSKKERYPLVVVSSSSAVIMYIIKQSVISISLVVQCVWVCIDIDNLFVDKYHRFILCYLLFVTLLTTGLICLFTPSVSLAVYFGPLSFHCSFHLANNYSLSKTYQFSGRYFGWQAFACCLCQAY